MSDKFDGVSIVPFEQLGGLLRGSGGHAVLVDRGRYRLQVGAIIAIGNGKFRVDVHIFDEMQGLDYVAGKFSEFFENFDSAVEAARAFLSSIRKEGT